MATEQPYRQRTQYLTPPAWELMENGNIILVVEAVTRVAQAESEMIKFVTEVVEDPLQLIQMRHSTINTKNTENVK